MNLHIGSEIEKVVRKKRIPINEFATQIGTVRRNVYATFDNDDISVKKLIKISELLDFNFFDLIQPVIKSDHEDQHLRVAESENQYFERSLKVHLEVEYPMSRAADLGTFITQVNALALKHGFKIA